MAAYNGFRSKIHIFCMIFVIIFSLSGAGMVLGDDENSLKPTDGPLTDLKEDSNANLNKNEVANAPATRGGSDLIETVYVSGNHVVVTTSFDLSNYQIFKANYTIFEAHFSGNNNGNGNAQTLPYSIGQIRSVRDIQEIKHSDSSFSFLLSNDYDLLVFYPPPSENLGLRTILFENGDVRSNYYQPVIGWARNGTFVTFYEQGYSDSFYPNILEDMIDKDAVYVFENYHLRSYYWFTNDSDIVQPMPNENDIFKEYSVTFNVKESQFITINSVYLCDIFDEYLDHDKNISDVVSGSDCHKIWESQIDAARNSFQVSDIFDSGRNSHFTSVNSRHLSRYLERYPDISFKFYPEKYEKTAVSFIFKNTEFKNVFEIMVPASRGSIVVPINAEKSTSSISSLEALTFPQDFIEESGESILNGVFVFIEEKEPEDYAHMFDDDMELYLFVDISFSNGNGDVINQFMNENDLTVSLTFSVPLLDENGQPTRLEDIMIYHITHDDEGQPQLNLLDIISIEIEGDFAVLTAHTTGFSPFAIAITPVVQPPEPPSRPRSSSSMFNNAVIIKNTPEENKSNESTGNNSGTPVTPTPVPPTVVPPLPDVDIISVVHGNLSIFSIFVVLMSGIFMWNYIRRNL